MFLETLIYALLQIFLLIVLGYAIRKIGVVSSEVMDGLLKLLVSIIIPFSVLSSGNKSSDAVTGESLLTLGIIAGLYYLISLVFCFLLFRVVGKKENANLNTAMSVFANTGFIGYPLSLILYGTEGLLYAVVHSFAFNLFFYTIGIKILNEKAKMRPLEIVKNPITIASFVAIILFVTQWKIPEALDNVITSVGNMSVPISMFIIGGMLVGVDIKHIIRNKSSYVVCFIRLIALPLITYFILKPLDLPSVMNAVMILITALPIASLNVIFARNFGADAEYANETMIMSLILSAVTVPLIVFILLH